MKKDRITNLAVSIIHEIRDFLFFFSLTDTYSNHYYRPFLIRLFGGKCGKNFSVAKCRFAGSLKNISFGNNVFINNGTFFHTGGKITIEDNVTIGFRSSFITGNHHIGPPSQRCGELFREDITIKKGVWIASYVIIGPGVTIDEGSVVSAGAVVMRSMPANCLIAGNPARVVHKLQLSEQRTEQKNIPSGQG